MFGDAGDDILTGGNSSFVGSVSNRISGGDGADTIRGGSAIGGPGPAAYNHLSGDKGDDLIIGGTADYGHVPNVLSGGDGNDTLVAGAGPSEWGYGTVTNSLSGDAGNDRLISDNADDQMWGGEGYDIFVFGPNNGQDTINDFEQGCDLIDLVAMGLSGLADLTISSDGTNSIVHLGGDNQITVLETASLGASDFAFA